MRHDQLKRREHFDIVEFSPEAVAQRPQPEKAVPDVPASVGVLITSAYGGLISILALTMARNASVAFVIVVDFVFLAAFLAVPAMFFGMDGAGTRKPTMSQFLRNGIQTATGHLSGAGALVQILVVPVLLSLGLMVIGIASLIIL